jgi:diguanylate cyclase (GGDEF)-like protein
MKKESPTSTPEDTMPEGLAGASPEIPQEHPEDAPTGWIDVQENLAESLNLSLLLVDGRQPPALALSNNNSICQAFQTSPELVRLCDPYCGDAHKRAMSAGSTVNYKCHAGLECFTMPVQIGKKKALAAIGGRAFVSVADYRSLVDRFRAGELNDLLARQPFENVIFAEPQRLEQLSARLERATRRFGEAVDNETEVQSPKSNVQSHIGTGSSNERVASEVQSAIANLETEQTYVAVEDDSVSGNEVDVQVYDNESTVAGGDAAPDEPEAESPTSTVESEVTTTTVGDQVQDADEVGQLQPNPLPDLQLEIDRLRGELEYRTHLAHSLQSFLERISSTDPDKTYNLILTHSKELLQAERASLWVFDEGSNEIILRAAAGFSEANSEVGRLRIGEGISGGVLESGQPLMIENLEIAGLTPAPAERNYKTNSFISYPITMSGRKIGVLNVTDKVGGVSFNTVDLSLLDVIGPQIAVALERAEWQERATQFQLMSITDPLTGLLNRRYLEERLTEELNRSKRYSYPMSCLMIDIDDFKSYNDRNGHQAGDVALKITAHSLKAALRSADIACRYGGEEFCILLPQTSLSEAGVIAERMRQKVTETDYPYGKAQPRGTVSISVGVSTFGKHIDTAESVIAAADRALYSAKGLGKNRIEFYLENLTSTAKK